MVYIDPKTFQCYATQNADATRIPDDEPLFKDKCQAFIEGYCCIPDGYSLMLSDGTTCPGRQVFPWKDLAELDAAQTQYEIDMAEAAAAYQEGVDSAYDQ
jgi:hypothetical protein